MRRVRPGPERDAFIRRMRERWAADDAALKRAGFPILGLAPPFPSPAGLGSFGTTGGQVTEVGLQYGGPGPAPAPLVTVTTALAPGDRGSLPVADVLQDLLTSSGDFGQSPPPGRGDPDAAEILIDGIPQLASILDNGRAWAAVADPWIDDVALLVTISARDWPLSGLALTQVDDLEPFLVGRRERVEAALARGGSHSGPEDWDLPAGSGLDGHRALADMMIAITRERMASGFPFQRSPLASNYAQSWEIATRAQMALAGQARDDAEDAIHSMVNHLCQLVQLAGWFTNPELARRAIGETLDYVAHGRDVPSAEAQQAWSRYWGLHGQEPPAFGSLSAAEESWLAAWQRWVDHR
jgi:hypothetical protein